MITESTLIEIKSLTAGLVKKRRRWKSKTKTQIDDEDDVEDTEGHEKYFVHNMTQRRCVQDDRDEDELLARAHRELMDVEINDHIIDDPDNFLGSFDDEEYNSDDEYEEYIDSKFH